MALHTYPRRLRIEMNLDPVPSQRIGQQLGRVPLFVAEKHRFLLDEGHPRS